MPATKKITKDMILDAALEIFRAEGFEAVTSRRIALRIGCSTQPIYFEYRNMDELKNDIIKKVVERLDSEFSLAVNEENTFIYRSFGVSFLKFVKSDPFVFRQIYISDGKIGKLVDDLRMPKILHILENIYGYERKKALAIHKMASCFLLGMAVQMVSDYNKISDEEIKDSLENLFVSICCVYGIPPKLAEKKEFLNHYEKIIADVKEI
ncbi:TetR/AcrR family transcriptional regulator [Treponema sp.]|uniref:TetR/AcrR family transcriptional regulator n=1 Tax=Treponema sp. TaxID=166 RepID=UPI003F03A414